MKNKFKVRSFSNPDVQYVVVIRGEKLKGRATCSCPAWIYRGERRDCKHIKMVRNGAVQVLAN